MQEPPLNSTGDGPDLDSKAHSRAHVFEGVWWFLLFCYSSLSPGAVAIVTEGRYQRRSFSHTEFPQLRFHSFISRYRSNPGLKAHCPRHSLLVVCVLVVELPDTLQSNLTAKRCVPLIPSPQTGGYHDRISDRKSPESSPHQSTHCTAQPLCATCRCPFRKRHTHFFCTLLDH